MIVTGLIAEVRAARAKQPGLTWGFVPTMGYLHEGHLSLVRRAKQENDRVAASIYVNPTQFAPTEDLASYPRDLARDLDMLAAEGVDLVFTPDDTVMYPAGFQTAVIVREITRYLEGASRPGHFEGVATVVAKLFNIVTPTRAYFGQKDAQQAAVLQQMIGDLNFDLELVVCPIVREGDGLALSSRNKYLNEPERAAALVLSRALAAAKLAYEGGERNGAALRQLVREQIAAEPLARLDYVSAADPLTLAEIETIERGVLLSLAVFFGRTRLIDNVLITPWQSQDQ